MRQSSELLLTFLLNATWQVLLITAAASLASWFLRESPARYRHYIWTTALLLAFLIPSISVSTGALEAVSTFKSSQQTNVAVESPQTPFNTPLPATLEVPNEPSGSATLYLNSTLASMLIFGYLALLAFRVILLAQGWRFASQVKTKAHEIIGNERVDLVINRCQDALGQPNRAVTVLRSSAIHVPVTFGLFRPVIILPEELLREDNLELLTSAIGHEYIHVARRDYFFNLIHEFLYLPLSFHPAAALIRRSIRQTRELCCDELVAERIIKPEAYARSLVKLAGCAPTPRRLSVTTTVGIADADILEARIMSLLKKSKTGARWKRMALVVVSLLLVVPCVAAAAFAMRFEMQSSGEVLVQEPLTPEKQQRRALESEKLKHEVSALQARLEQLAAEPVSPEKQPELDREKRKISERIDFLKGQLTQVAQDLLVETQKQREFEREKLSKQIGYLQGRLTATDQESISPEMQKEREELKEKLNQEIELLQQKLAGAAEEMEAKQWRREEEIKAKMIAVAAMARLARIQMDQAIQIATSLHPGKVLSSALRAENWEEPGRLAKDGRVFYHIVVLSGDEANQETTHVFVNAIDGTIIRVEKELPRKQKPGNPE